MITQYPAFAVGITYEHQKTHEGRYFSGGYYNASVESSGTVEILVQMSTDSWHSKATVNVGGDSTVQIFEGTTFSGAGTAVTMSNHNRASSKTFSGTVTHTPTLTSAGTQINGTILIPGGSGGNATVGEIGFANEFVLKASTVYMIRVMNVSTGSIPISITVEGYQPTL